MTTWTLQSSDAPVDPPSLLDLAAPLRARLRPRPPVYTGAVARRVGQALMRHGGGRDTPAIPRLLRALGVLDRAPEDWEDEAVVEALPWGAQDDRFPRAPRPEGVEGPWPQAPVVHPGFFPPVLHLDDAERRQHREVNVARYLGQLVLLLPGAAARAALRPRVRRVSDARFLSLITTTSLAQFLHLGLEPAQEEAFAAHLGGGRTARVDASALTTEHLLPGVYAAPTVTLLEEAPGGWSLVAIRCGEEVLTPADGDGWELAKLFVLQGLGVLLINLLHPRLHFSGDAICAATRSLLPGDHLLSRLLAPHGELTLGLHEAVIHHRRSVLHNSQRELYSPFPHTASGIHHHVALGLSGTPDNRAYGAFSMDAVLIGEHTAYGRWRRAWFDHIEAFVGEVVSRLPEDDAHLGPWADAVHVWLPDFPDAEAARHRPTLARALALYIFTVSVCHTGDHHSYAGIPLEEIPMRLRQAPPQAGAACALDLDSLVTPEDALRHRLCHPMFFAPCIVSSLASVDYAFEDPGAAAAARAFRAGFEALDAAWAGSTFPASGQIAASVQY